MLKQQVKQGDLAGLREYLARTRKERDWQDRFFMLGLVVPSARLAALDFACEAEPEAADLFLIRCAFFCELAATMRGGGTCEQVGEERFRNAAECIRAALTDLDKATQLDGQDPTAYAYVLPSLTIFGQLLPRQQYAFQRATELAPDFVPAYRAIVTTLSERWHGSHEKSLQFARFALTKAGPGSDMPVCLFWAHLLVRTHLSSFDKNMEAAKAYIRNPEVNKELASAFDSWTEGLEVATRSSIPYLHHAACWFYLADDRARLKRALSLTNNVFSKVPWSWFGNATEVYANAVLAAAGQQPQQRDKSDPCAECLAIVAYSTDAMQNGKTAEAERGLAAALVLARSSPEQASHLVPLVLLYLASLRKTQRRDEDSRKLREQAVAMLDANSAPLSVARYQHLMANVLNKLGEYQRSLPFWEQAIQLTGEETSAEQMASMLHDMGTCYSRVGLRDHATIPLRAAIKVFAAGPSDPRLPVALLSLGNALRKSSPVEAEACYKQAAELHAAQAQYESAASAWVNLGVLSSAQGRHSEALEHYDRALKVREQTRGTPPAKIALILNNMADCYRRMGRFAEAHTSVNRAIKLLSSGDATLASAYDTRGRIFLDSGDDAHAVEWLRKARAERKKQPSPDLDALVDALQIEIAALKRLGKHKDAASAEEILANVQSSLQSIPLRSAGQIADKEPTEGAVLIELTFGSGFTGLEGRPDTRFISERLARDVRSLGVGHYGGCVAIPENTTVILYGRDAEVLFKAVEPSLWDDPICAGARVIIRQGDVHREIAVPRESRTVN
jgi:tetratricopeptide (TPR) repeat protein